MMVNLKINGKPVCVEEGTTILEAAREAAIKIPTLCHFKGLNQIGACRVCVVEVEGCDRLTSACDTPVAEGMSVLTDSPRARKARRTNIQLILSEHDGWCPTCERSGNCALQRIANGLNVPDIPYERKFEETYWPRVPVIRNEAKCIKCMRCIQVCDKIQGMHIWDLAGTGGRTTVGVTGNRSIDATECTYCGQCITHCPTGALTARDDTEQVFRALEDPDIVTVVQVAPAVRTAWADSFGVTTDFASPGRMAAAMRAVGFDYVFDTNFTADLTIMEEGSEFIERFTHKSEYKWPMFTSCCPGWVRFLKSQYPEYTDNLSTAKSPQQMFGAVAKSYFAQKMGIDPHKIFCVSVMPCSAKKSECDIPGMNDACGDKDVDVVITTREFARILKAKGIDVTGLPEERFDSPLGSGTGAAIIFGATGGVMDAALRSAYYLVTGKNPDPDTFTAVRGTEKAWREATFAIPGAGAVKVAVTSGLANTRALMEAVKQGKVDYDFVEIMACPGGCAGGGGQPISEGEELAAERGDILWELDRKSYKRFSHENSDVKEIYSEFFGKPLGELSHHLLHTDHHAWEMPEQD